MRKKIILSIVMTAGIMAATSAMADVTIGNPPDPGAGNSFPWGYAYNAEYQQVYARSDFSVPITITNLEFFNTSFNSTSTQLPTGSWTISLSTTSVNPSNITTNFASNIGTGNTVVFSGNINQPWVFGNTLHIALSTPFTYNPANGNLLMDVVGSGVTAPGGTTFFDVHSNSGGIFTRVYCPSGIACSTGVVDSNFGLVTDFSTGNVPNVPEPASLALLGLGLAGLGFSRARSRKNHRH